ncbi:Actin-related protein 2/3 complex subunit 3 [Wallemia ichthyophaga EXF-994]|uniref:Actin-related protein 2/3 complex subunit 3 n=1 Tax=Wallemia ichthyophaga (strain EXF-994 / CBS 113033) TaxID=1299270 RepID=R9AAW7_WALI9|nr:Actin-related protein 2/3 complex subunit 3 [Wallemia ichthyophaga EXF-994]EOQ99209.1 Actin-related protein 2/3 complex subunit 3 [Wallemia ichthyophaga EXF-994]
MPAYHSNFNDDKQSKLIGNVSILPFSSKHRGIAPTPPNDPEYIDIISESIILFRANSLFRNFEIKGGGDRMLIYLILFISDCIAKLSRGQVNSGDAMKQLHTLAVDSFSLPGEAGFPLNSLYAPPQSKMDADTLRSYLTQARVETVNRLIPILYAQSNTSPDKYWMSFNKRKFMGKSLSL